MRTVTRLTKLGNRIYESGKPVYAVCGETHIAYTRMLRYVNLHEAIRVPDLLKLAEYFDCDPEELIGPNLEDVSDVQQRSAELARSRAEHPSSWQGATQETEVRAETSERRNAGEAKDSAASGTSEGRDPSTEEVCPKELSPW